MSDFDGGAAAPAESAPAPANETPVTPVQETTQPLGNQAPVAEKTAPPEKAEVPSKSPREALEKAFAKIEKADKPQSFQEKPAAEPKAKEIAKPDAQPTSRDETGRFASSKPATESVAPEPKPTSYRDAPQRFDDAAKAEWASAPESVKGAITRTIREMEAGIEKHRSAAQEFETVREFAEMARTGGNTLRTALETYVGLERMIDQNPIGALEKIAQMKGFTLRQVAEHVLGQSPDQQASARDHEILELRQTISGLQRQLGGVSQTLQSQHNERTLQDVQSFAANHPRFDELGDAIAAEIKLGFSLEEAYARADRLNPASEAKPLIPAKSPAPAQTRNDASADDAGMKSIAGAPAGGSDPTGHAPSKSNREALKRAFAAHGLI